MLCLKSIWPENTLWKMLFPQKHFENTGFEGSMDLRQSSRTGAWKKAQE